MESHKEKIEAQLAAYIDGELSDAERADIERHLAANPQHKSLMRELFAQRDLLTSLPRATVPLELNQALCGQLERSALLDPASEANTDVIYRVNRWPQFAAVAAVILLATGLGIVVAYVLPNDSRTVANNGNNISSKLTESDSESLALKRADRDLKLRTAQAGQGIELAKAGEQSMDSQLRRSANVTRKFSQDNLAGEAASANKVAANDERFSGGGVKGAGTAGGVADAKTFGRTDGSGTAGKGFAIAGVKQAATDGQNGRTLVTAAEVDRLRKELSLDGGTAAAAGNAKVYLMVSAANTASASSQVTAYFRENNISYMSAEEAAPERLKEKDMVERQVPSADKSDNRSQPELSLAAKTGDGGNLAAMPAQGPAATNAQAAINAPATIDENARAGGNVAKESGANEGRAQDAPRPDTFAQARAGKGGQEEMKKTEADPRGGAGFGGGGGGGRGFKPEAKDAAPARETTLGDNAREFGYNAPANHGGGQPVLIARMNRRQALQLGALLSRQEGQRAEVRDFDNGQAHFYSDGVFKNKTDDALTLNKDQAAGRQTESGEVATAEGARAQGAAGQPAIGQDEAGHDRPGPEQRGMEKMGVPAKRGAYAAAKPNVPAPASLPKPADAIADTPAVAGVSEKPNELTPAKAKASDPAASPMAAATAPPAPVPTPMPAITPTPGIAAGGFAATGAATPTTRPATPAVALAVNPTAKFEAEKRPAEKPQLQNAEARDADRALRDLARTAPSLALPASDPMDEAVDVLIVVRPAAVDAVEGKR